MARGFKSNRGSQLPMVSPADVERALLDSKRISSPHVRALHCLTLFCVGSIPSPPPIVHDQAWRHKIGSCQHESATSWKLALNFKLQQCMPGATFLEPTVPCHTSVRTCMSASLASPPFASPLSSGCHRHQRLYSCGGSYISSDNNATEW